MFSALSWRTSVSGAMPRTVKDTVGTRSPIRAGSVMPWTTRPSMSDMPAMSCSASGAS